LVNVLTLAEEGVADAKRFWNFDTSDPNLYRK